MESKTSLSELISYFEQLPGNLLTFQSPEQFQKDWETILGAKEAKKHKEVVYLWRTEKPIPRLRGENDIIYIGKTKNSISTRHHRYAHIEATGNRNRPRYEYILKNFGPITFHVAKYDKFADELKIAEQRLLAEYFKNHLEYPPLNRMGK